jgi:hypothetical protein
VRNFYWLSFTPTLIAFSGPSKLVSDKMMTSDDTRKGIQYMSRWYHRYWHWTLFDQCRYMWHHPIDTSTYVDSVRWMASSTRMWYYITVLIYQTLADSSTQGQKHLCSCYMSTIRHNKVLWCEPHPVSPGQARLVSRFLPHSALAPTDPFSCKMH